MKATGFFLLCWVLTAPTSFADSYSITIPPGGCELVANQLSGNTTLNQILGIQPHINVLAWNCQSQGFTTYYYKTTGVGGTGWRSSGSTSNPVGDIPVFVPGRGEIIQNTASTNDILVFTGTPHSPVYPATNLCASSPPMCIFSWLGSETNAPATYEDIVGAPPEVGTQVFRHNAGSSCSMLPPSLNYTIHTYLGGAWTPSTPVANVGESVGIKICTSNTPCLQLSCPTNFTVESGATWDFDTPTLITNLCGTANVTSTFVTVTNGICRPTSFTRTWLFTDEYDDVAICSQTVTFVSISGPLYPDWASHYGPLMPGDDLDGDGMSNTNEFLAGFDPTNNAAALRIIGIEKSGDDIRVTYLGANGDTSYPSGPESRTNVLEFTAGAADGSYSNNFVSTGVTNILSCGIGCGVVTNMMEVGGATNSPSRFYRVRVIVP